MRSNKFDMLKAFTFYRKTLMMLGEMSDEKVIQVIRATADYISGNPKPDTSEIANGSVANLIDEICGCIDDAEDKRQNLSNAGKKGMTTRYNADDSRPVKDISTENEKGKPDKMQKEIQEIIDYLNLKAGKKFSVKSEATKKHIRARLDEGYEVGDFFRVIDNKVTQWKGTEWEKFLRPQTLFNSEKFDGYLNENPDAQQTKTKMQADCEKITGWLERRNQG